MVQSWPHGLFTRGTLRLRALNGACDIRRYSRRVASRVDGGDWFSFVFVGARLRFAWERDALGLERAFHFVDADHARQFLDALTRDERVWPMLRMLWRQSPHLHGEDHLQADELLAALAHHLAHRTLVVTEGQEQARPGGGKVVPPKRPTTKPPPPPIAPATFIEIELVDQQGRPVPRERYVITLPDGKERRGRLDDRGLARIDGIRPAGVCDVSFPDIHADEWKPG